MSTNNLDLIIETVMQTMETADQARELALPRHRLAIRQCSLAVRAIHRREFSVAREHLDQARQVLHEIDTMLKPHPEIYFAGFLQDAQKEFAEASLTLAVVTQAPLPSPQDLQVSDAPYVNGLAECVGELRRHSLDRMRQGDTAESERLLEVMDEIFFHLTTLDFPDGITRGLRRNTDIARGCLEKTRGELTACHENQHLIAEMTQLRCSVEQCTNSRPTDR